MRLGGIYLLVAEKAHAVRFCSRRLCNPCGGLAKVFGVRDSAIHPSAPSLVMPQGPSMEDGVRMVLSSVSSR